jgi:hypothetical protein
VLKCAHPQYLIEHDSASGEGGFRSLRTRETPLHEASRSQQRNPLPAKKKLGPGTSKGFPSLVLAEEAMALI